LIPSDSEGLLVQQYAEKYGKPSYEITVEDLTSLEASLKNDFFVGVFLILILTIFHKEKLSLADIVLFSLIFQKQYLLEKFTNISKWFERLSKEKHFQDALTQLGFSK
jgi:glutathione S-transferase